MRAARSSLPSGSSGRSLGSLAQASASSIMASMTGCMPRWPNITAPSITSSDNSEASDSTISTPSRVPATTKFKSDEAISSSGVFNTYSPPM